MPQRSRKPVGKQLRGIRWSTGVSIAYMARKLSIPRDELIELENSPCANERWVDAYLDAVGLDSATG